MPTGRPSRINQELKAGDGKTVTVADRVLDYIRAGAHVAEAAAAVGISRETIYAWLRKGADVSLALALADSAGTPAPVFSDHDMACAEFADGHHEAIASWEMRQLLFLQQLAQGGIPQTTTRTKVGAKGVEETVTTTSHTLPDATVITWLLEKRHPDRYGRRIGLDVDTGAAGAGTRRALELTELIDQVYPPPPQAIEAAAIEAP